MNCHFLSLLSVLLFVNHSISDQLDDARQSCKTKQISIPSGKTTLSDPIRLSYRDSVLIEIIDEECRKFNEPDRHRSKRSKGSVLKGFIEFGKKAATYAKPAVKYGLQRVKIGSKKVLKTGARIATSDFGLHALADVYESTWNIKDALNSSEEESDENDQRKESRKVEKQIEGFRNDVNNLLYDKEIQGYIGETPQIIKLFNKNIDSKIRASNVKCVKNDFSGVYSIRLQLEIEEKVEVVARRCADIGDILRDQKIYEFYELSNQFLVEKDGKSFSVNGTLCSDSTPPFCPHSSLERVSCSVMSIQHCEKRFENLNEKHKVSRILPSGIVYYGPSEVLTLKRNDRTLKFAINPHHLEYIRIFEGDKVWIGDDVAYE